MVFEHESIKLEKNIMALLRTLVELKLYILCRREARTLAVVLLHPTKALAAA
jgi:hypothetical protein